MARGDIAIKYLDDKGNFFADNGGRFLLATMKDIAETVKVYPQQLNDETQLYALFHGVKQKLGDAAAKEKGTTNAQKWELIKEQAISLTGDYNYGEASSWFKNRTGGGGYSVAKLIEATIRVEKIQKQLDDLGAEREAKIKDLLTNASNDKRTAFANKPAIKHMLTKMREEELATAAKDADDDLMDLFDDERYGITNKGPPKGGFTKKVTE